MGLSERADAFWEGIAVPRLDGEIVIRHGFRFQWTRNELGALYLKSLGQVGYELRPRITLAEYQRQCREMAEAHAAALSPEIKAHIGYEVAMAGMFAWNPPPVPADMETSGAVFL